MVRWTFLPIFYDTFEEVPILIGDPNTLMDTVHPATTDLLLFLSLQVSSAIPTNQSL